MSNQSILNNLIARWNRLAFWHRLLLILLIVAAFAVIYFTPMPSLETIRLWIGDAGILAPLAYLGLMIVFTQLPFPRTVWTIAGGILFGPVMGVGLMLIGLAVSAGLSLSLVRWLGDKILSPPAATEHESQALRTVIEQRGWIAILGLRMVPVVPFSVLNYAAALSPIPLLPFVLATLGGSLPNTVVLVLAADSLVDYATTSTVQTAVLITAVVFMLVGLVITVREAWTWKRMMAVGTAEDLPTDELNNPSK